MDMDNGLSLALTFAQEALDIIYKAPLFLKKQKQAYRTMSFVVVMLKGETVTLSQPQQPAFFVGRYAEHHQALAQSCCVNGVTISR
ncbi:S-locus receptor kinase [Theobroma cacao]|nr:S-locus receptor kinase [Theobroma cacao]